MSDVQRGVILCLLFIALIGSLFMTGYTYHRDFKVEKCDIGEIEL